jgi:D-galactose 1-dehydrogenase
VERQPIKLAIIGLGHVAKYQIEAVGALSNIDLVAANDIDPDRAGILPSGVMFVSDLDKLLDLPDVDLFMVSTPNQSHYEVGKLVLKHDRPLLLEKPCCDSMDKMHELEAQAKTRGQFFSIALHAMYGRDVLWYEEYLKEHSGDLGPLTGFHGGFFDPYYQQGKLEPSAAGLGGSWFDSGINALSVIGKFLDPNQLKLIEGRLTKIDSLACSDIQGAASFEFWSSGQRGNGIVETNWSLGLNRKITELYYALTNTRVTLNHSAERVVIEQEKTLVHQEELQTNYPRLTNHYINLFTDIVRQFHTGTTNVAYAEALHKLLFEASRPN